MYVGQWEIKFLQLSQVSPLQLVYWNQKPNKVYLLLIVAMSLKFLSAPDFPL
jgi:hypothetical protein